VWEADATGGFSFVSDRAEAILGYPVALWLADPSLRTHIHPDDREWTLTLFREAAARGPELQLRVPCRRADARTSGSGRWFTSSKTRMEEWEAPRLMVMFPAPAARG